MEKKRNTAKEKKVNKTESEETTPGKKENKTEVERAPRRKKMSKTEFEEILVNNFINLQRVLTNLSVKFDELSSNMSKMLQLFEISAKSFAEKYTDEGLGKSDKAFLNKLDSLLDQNKTISKGIMMMEERIRDRAHAPQRPEFQRSMPGRFNQVKSRPLPKY